MKFFLPKDITITASSLPENTDQDGTVYPSWAKADGYQKEKIVVNEKKLYQANTNILPLATYTWNDISEYETPEVIRLIDDVVMPDPTAVPCVNGATIVYVIYTWKDNGGGGGGATATATGKYFKYTGSTGDVDFTTINPSSPANFSEISGYRHETLEPTGTQTSLYWKYLGHQNRERCIDKGYNSQSIINNTTEEWWEFTAKNLTTVVLFNLQAITAKITLYTTDINDPLYENETDTLINKISITSRRTWMTFVREDNYTKNTMWQIPFLIGEYTVRITLKNVTAGTLKLGELLVGQKTDYGKATSEVPTKIKSSAKETVLENGEIVLENEGDLSKIFVTFDFSLLFDTNTYDQIIDRSIYKLINRRVVIFAEDSDSPRYRNLIIYGYTKESSPTLNSSGEMSGTRLQIERFN